MTGMPAWASAARATTDGPAPSSLTPSAPASLTRRMLLSMACSSDDLVRAERQVAEEEGVRVPRRRPASA